MSAVQVDSGVWYVGVRDWNVRDFHGYKTGRGTSYNAYLIVGEQGGPNVLIDTVKANFAEEFLANIKQIIEPSQLDYIIVNHVEMDHSGALPFIMQHAPQAQILASRQGETGLASHYDVTGWQIRSVQNGEMLKIGNKTLAFYLTPRVHWPDSMVTYLEEHKLLFSNDAFGQHIAGDIIFEQPEQRAIIFEEAARYYANIIYPLGEAVINTLQSMGHLSLQTIAPSHGLIWRNNIEAILAKYGQWARHESVNKAVVVYDSMWGSTEQMARAIAVQFEENNVPATIRSLKFSHVSDVVTDVLEARYVCLGTPTLNNCVLPTMGGFLTYIKGLKPQFKIGMAFNSYGWYGKTINELDEFMQSLDWQVVPGVKARYRPDQKCLADIKTAVNSMCKIQVKL